MNSNRSFFGSLRFAGIVMAALAALSAFPHAQAVPPAPAAPPAAPRVTNVSILHLNVTNLAQSLALYRDVLGMELTAPLAAPRAGGALVSEPGGMLQTTILRVPGGTFSMELVEWTGIPLRPQQARIQDPGAIMLALFVRDLDAKLAGVKRLGLKVLTTNGEPFVSEGRGGGRNRAVMVRDPSGFIVELEETVGAPAGGAPLPPGPISSVAIWLTVQDLAQTVNFYNRVFGFTLPAAAEARPAPERIKALFGDTSLATVRMARGTFPGTETGINFQEFSGPDRKPVRHRVQDPGGPIFTMTAPDFPAVIDGVRANGGIIGDGATSATLAPDARASWVRDPNGLLIRLSAPQPPRGGGAAPAAAPQGGR